MTFLFNCWFFVYLPLIQRGKKINLKTSKLNLGSKTEKKSNGLWSTLFCMNVLCDLLNLKFWIILLIISDSSFFKAKSISGYYWITSQLSWEAAWLLAKCGSPVYLVVDELRPCALWRLMTGLIVVLLTFFWHGEYAFTYRDLRLF